ncbi:tlde1 domain-containing protein [Pantoea agglomerans]|uniref:tlde1 domain-containing protein n=1 Tax=Enterobacter agglomerans TaxID=549 RepID=UPI0015FE2B62|nr:tlde1 domain-containing protein [Pantoea agglomerans]
MNEKPLPTSYRERLNVRTRNVERGNFRLHPRGPLGVSLGCITLQHRTDFIAIRQALLSTSQVKLCNGLMSFGTIEVVLNGSKTCPSGV